ARAAAGPGGPDVPATPPGLPQPLYETRLSYEYRNAVRGLALVQSLMDAAPLAAAELGLRVGQAPTAEQLARATRDFVWYVRET
ncbi:hypothetical protein, partial [Bordetella pertussis]|uniref:hypothetical protein n=1 Tax=Bordetella pertussis TaxID=520 RepID=UPI000B1202FC